MKSPIIKLTTVVLVASLFGVIGCNRTKEIKPSADANTEVVSQSQVFGSGAASTSQTDEINNDIHTVKIIEILPTQKYIYLKVVENESDEFWIATLKQEVKKGEQYVYTGGLLKTNFKSLEHNRVFDKLYLVNKILPANHGEQMNTDEPAQTNEAPIVSENIVIPGSVRIAAIVANPKKYAGKTIQVSGKCVKVNPNIMDKNWMHLKDGSKDDYDFVVTSDKAIPVGHNVTFKGTLTVNKDFGAGYQYDIILENAVLLEK